MDKKQKYEEAVKELEVIVEQLEKGDIALDESLDLFQKGVTLAAYCGKKLDETERQIIKLMEEEGQCKEEKWLPEEET